MKWPRGAAGGSSCSWVAAARPASQDEEDGVLLGGVCGDLAWSTVQARRIWPSACLARGSAAAGADAPSRGERMVGGPAGVGPAGTAAPLRSPALSGGARGTRGAVRASACTVLWPTAVAC
eukprot:9635096-Alexandrium_andersonii.AAC.1